MKCRIERPKGIFFLQEFSFYSFVHIIYFIIFTPYLETSLAKVLSILEKIYRTQDRKGGRIDDILNCYRTIEYTVKFKSNKTNT
jgi:hypothetical protein